MATPMTRVRRGGQGDADVAMVGDPNENGAAITIDPSERETPPIPPEDENWDLPKDQRPTPRNDVNIEPEDEPVDEDDVRLAYDESEEEQNIRSGRRSRRNRSRRGAIDQRDQTIQMLSQELQRQGNLLQNLYGGQFNLSARDIDQRIQFNSSALERADIELARAVKDSDGEAFAAINKERDKIYRELFQLQGMRENLESRARETFTPQQPQGQAQGGQPQLTPEQQQYLQDQESEFERMRDIFLDRYQWFDPDQGNDADHRLVKRIDAEVTQDGYQRHTKAFWHEMERRMRDEGFAPESRESEMEQPTRRQVNGNGHARGGGFESRRSTPPTGAVRGTRRPGTNGGYALSEVEQDILEGEGLLESNLSKEDAAKRDRIIGKWQRGKQALRGR